MPDETESRQWIVEPPPRPGEISLYLACGDEVELSPEQEAALSALLRSLEYDDAEVVGHGTCTSKAGCGEYSACWPSLTCGKVTCGLLMCNLSGAAAPAGSGSWSLMGSFSAGPA